MPDGTLMSDAEHARLNGSGGEKTKSRTNRAWKNKAPDLDRPKTAVEEVEAAKAAKAVKVINSVEINLSPLPAASKTLPFKITGDEGATFTFELKNEDSAYYNFDDKIFQTAKVVLEKAKIDKAGYYMGEIVFPTVTDDDQYDISIFAEPITTKHIAREEVRFGDGSLDINSSTGSDSLLINKVIYQNLNKTLTIGTFSPNSTIETGSKVNTVLSLVPSRTDGDYVNKQAFSVSCAVTTATKCYRVIKQPTSGDLISYVEPVVGSAPITIEGENQYPVVTATGKINVAVSSSTTVTIDGLSATPLVGDKFEIIDGPNSTSPQIVTVVNEGNIISSVAISAANDKTIQFSNQTNRQWPIDNFTHLIESGMEVLPNTNVVANTKIGAYITSVLELEGTKYEKNIILKAIPSKSTKNIKPTIVKGEVTVQSGSVIFDKAQLLALGGQTIKIGGYGEEIMTNIHGYELVFSDLAIALTPVTTTTTAAVNNSTSVPVTSRNGILDDVSTVSGIGINPALVDPTVDTGAGAVTGAGTLVLTAAQTLEDNAVLTFANAGQTATITGNVKVIKVGSSNAAIEFDVERLLSIT